MCFEKANYKKCKDKKVEVNVGVIGKIFSVGTVKIDIGKTETYSTGGHNSQGQQTGSQIHTKTMYTNFTYIGEPYKVYQAIQSAISNRVEGLYSGRADRESQNQNSSQ